MWNKPSEVTTKTQYAEMQRCNRNLQSSEINMNIYKVNDIENLEMQQELIYTLYK